MNQSNDNARPERQHLVREAIAKGIPLNKVGDYLDWLECLERAETSSEREIIMRRGVEFQPPPPEA